MPPHICIIIAKFYQHIADELLKGALVALEAHSKEITYEVIEVPGAFEIPGAMSMAIESARFEGYVALGCVIRGETTHYDYVCAESARGINQLAIDTQAALGYGILTVENEEQALERASVAKGNKGADAVNACITMIKIKNLMEI
ncbi:MAG: 6,7-dimethyl-8-ribityllumazine synthase [Pseudomonadota bacterium]